MPCVLICEKCQLFLVDAATILSCKCNSWTLLQRKLVGYSSPPFLHMLLLSSLVFDEESAGPLAVVIIPCLLTLSTVLVVALIFYNYHKNKRPGAY